MDISRYDWRFINGNEIGATDPELWLEHLLNTSQRLFTRHQFSQSFRRKTHTSNTAQQPRFPFVNTNQHGLERRCLSNAIGNGAKRLLKGLIEIQDGTDLS